MPNIHFVGTGSATPSCLRNSSAIMCEENGQHLLIDCGERTLTNIFALHGMEAAKKILENLKIILISHIHLDHSVGLVSMLKYLIENDIISPATKLPIIAHRYFFSQPISILLVFIQDII